ncbi:MAG: phosphoribosylformylglycinamidine synthase [Phycisphaera sp.]|nr:phosphoribosylformylglycinamidine synthase [Phycisphaera sp.]
MKPTALILRSAGTNCDRELAHAFELAGAATQALHVHKLIADPGLIEQFDLIGFPGGFSYGDDIAAGRILANQLRHRLLEPLQDAVRRGVPMIGICNGFQVLVKMGLLPDPLEPKQTVTLADNTSGRFTDRWIRLVADSTSVCLWTRSLDQLDLPIAHGEGRFTGHPDVISRLRDNHQVALRYAHNDNPNGSLDDIAGICDPTGSVLGLMPHPERFTDPTHHPQWTRQSPDWLTQTPAGLRFFHNAVEHVRQGKESHAGVAQSAG